MNRKNETSPTIVATGWPTLNALLGGGLRVGEVTVIAAERKMGKSTICNNLYHDFNEKGQVRAIYNLMKRGSEFRNIVHQTLLTSLVENAYYHTDKSKWYDGWREELLPMYQQYLPWIHPIIKPKPMEILAKKNETAPILSFNEVLLIDPLQLTIVKNSIQSRHQQLSSLIKMLKAIAVFNHMHIIVTWHIAQVHRLNGNDRPTLADIKHPTIIDTADNILLLFNEEVVQKPSCIYRYPVLEVHVVKQPSQQTGCIELLYDQRHRALFEAGDSGRKNDKNIPGWAHILWRWADKYRLSAAQLPRTFDQLLALKHLSLNGQGIKDLPNEIGYLQHLKHLLLTDNRLQTLPDSIGQLTQLSKINLANNRLKTLPVSIGKLQHLKSLSLAANQLSSLPISLGRLSQLRYLNVSYNRLLQLPFTFVDLAALRHLNICHNKSLTALPSPIDKLSQLNTLLIDQTALKYDMKRAQQLMDTLPELLALSYTVQFPSPCENQRRQYEHWLLLDVEVKRKHGRKQLVKSVLNDKINPSKVYNRVHYWTRKIATISDFADFEVDLAGRYFYLENQNWLHSFGVRSYNYQSRHDYFAPC